MQGNFGKDHQRELNTPASPHVETKEERLRPVHVLRSSSKSAGLLLPSAALAEFGNGEVAIGAGVTA